MRTTRLNCRTNAKVRGKSTKTIHLAFLGSALAFAGCGQPQEQVVQAPAGGDWNQDPEKEEQPQQAQAGTTPVRHGGGFMFLPIPIPGGRGIASTPGASGVVAGGGIKPPAAGGGVARPPTTSPSGTTRGGFGSFGGSFGTTT